MQVLESKKKNPFYEVFGQSPEGDRATTWNRY
jgi:hypothetical protein